MKRVFPTRLCINQHQEESGNEQVAAKQQIGENLMVVRTQRMGVDPRDEATHSHLPESTRTRGPSEIKCTGNNPRRSTMRNVFNKLGSGADMRKMLNSRRKQELSQLSTS